MTAAQEKTIKLARERFKQGQEANQKQLKREKEDLAFYAGEQWDSDILESRKGQTIGTGTTAQVIPARPSLTINKTREPVRQVLNQERNADLGITVIPADDFGDIDTSIDHTEIKLREGLVRRIQRDSESADARTWAFSRSAIAGQGYWGVMTRYVPKRADQEIYIHRFFDQNAVTLDPAHEQPDASDIDWGFVGADMAADRFDAEFPNEKRDSKPFTEYSNDEWRSIGEACPGWYRTEGETRIIRVVDYWYVTRDSVELFHLADGQALEKEAYDAAVLQGAVPELEDQKPVSHKDIRKRIDWCKLTGDRILDETEWPGHYIPIIKVLGEELQPYDQERRAEGIVRPMIDPCRGNNYVISKFVERVGLTPLSPWMMAAGQDEGYEAEYNAANTRTLSRLHYNQKDSEDRPAPPPFRTDARSEIGDLAFGVQMFGQAITSTSVVPETALGNTQPGVKSGRMARLLIDQATQGTSNFLDNLVRSMRHEARIINDLLYPIYGRPGRLAKMMDPEGEMTSVLVGQPFVMQGNGPQKRPVPAQPGDPNAQSYKLTPDAEFNVAVKVTKNFETRREEEDALLTAIVEADPQQLQVVGDLLFKFKDSPGHEQISDRYKAVLLPAVKATLPENQQDAAAMQAKIAELEQMIQQLQPMAEKNAVDIGKAQLSAQTSLQDRQLQEQAATERAQAQSQIDLQRAQIDDHTKLAIEEAKNALEYRKLEVQLEIEMAKLGQAAAVSRAQVEMDALHLHSSTQQAEADRNESSVQADLDRQAAQEQAQMAQAAKDSNGTDGNRPTA